MEEDCPFCTIGEHVEVLCKTDIAMAILDSFPISPGHTLVIPKNMSLIILSLLLKSRMNYGNW